MYENAHSFLKQRGCYIMFFYLLYIYLPTSDSFRFSSLHMLYPFTPTISLMLLRQLLNRFESRHLPYFIIVIVFSTFVACRTDIQTSVLSSDFCIASAFRISGSSVDFILDTTVSGSFSICIMLLEEVLLC